MCGGQIQRHISYGIPMQESNHPAGRRKREREMLLDIKTTDKMLALVPQVGQMNLPQGLGDLRVQHRQ